MNELEMEHRITAVEKLAKGNERRIGDLESDNKALLDLSTSVAVMAEQMKTMSSKVDSMDAAVKRLQSVPASRWEGLIKAAVTAVVAGLVGYALALAGLGG
nr:MAG TPA: hemolysin [Caudoviricetes sp.]